MGNKPGRVKMRLNHQAVTRIEELSYSKQSLEIQSSILYIHTNEYCESFLNKHQDRDFDEWVSLWKVSQYGSQQQKWTSAQPINVSSYTFGFYYLFFTKIYISNLQLLFHNSGWVTEIFKWRLLHFFWLLVFFTFFLFSILFLWCLALLFILCNKIS